MSEFFFDVLPIKLIRFFCRFLLYSENSKKRKQKCVNREFVSEVKDLQDKKNSRFFIIRYKWG
jgi:hypothetical protein